MDTVRLRSSEVELIRRVAQTIKSNISELQTVEKLAREVGLNINKLQEGFKILYHTTVSSYVQQMRLEMAQNLLLNSDYNISEIVNIIGLSSKSYFSKIFKDAYEISPSTFRKKNKTINTEISDTK